MKETHSGRQLTVASFDTPLLNSIRNLAHELFGINFLVVFPQEGGWGQAAPPDRKGAPEFCQLLWKSKAGIKHCKMCHILMSVAASRQGLTEQRCHAGACVLVMPLNAQTEGTFAVVSSCMYAPADGTPAWEEAKERGMRLGVDIKELRKAFQRLPHFSEEKRKKIIAVMNLFGEAVRELALRVKLANQVKELEAAPAPRLDTGRTITQALRSALAVPEVLPPEERKASSASQNKGSPVVDVVAVMVADKPHMPFSVSDIAAAARMTPNHFSTLFHRHKGKSFSQFLTECRMNLAKALLRDQTLNIQEVALRCGYSDPGYFTRRFRQETRLTPREWRNSLRLPSSILPEKAPETPSTPAPRIRPSPRHNKSGSP